MFDEKSRYQKADTFVAIDVRGRAVVVVAPPPPLPRVLLGIHLLKQGERLDHLAAKYLNNPAEFWRIAEQNNVMLPEALSGVWGFSDTPTMTGLPDAVAKPPEIEIPTPNT
jgi:hypothetical protein